MKFPEDCCGCEACIQICPVNCITMKEDREGFLYPNANKTKCIKCGRCQAVCPLISSHKIRGTEIPEAYALIARDDKIKKRSSSGGAFSLLAKSFFNLNPDGIVIGCEMDSSLMVKHVVIEDYDSTFRICKSKYVQSTINNTYRIAGEYLKSQKAVLFSGTPCQIYGLHNYLGKDFPGLVTIDFACHGVGSPKVWRKYLNETAKEKGNEIKKAVFRWKGQDFDLNEDLFGIYLEYISGETEVKYKSPYMESYLRNMCLRPSCYKCEFKGTKRDADITLADFWGGSEESSSLLELHKAVSLVLVNTVKGKNLFEQIEKNEAVILSTNAVKAVKNNSKLLVSPRIPLHRENFFEKLDKLSMNQLVSRYVNPHKRIKALISLLLRKTGMYSTVNKIRHKLMTH